MPVYDGELSRYPAFLHLCVLSLHLGWCSVFFWLSPSRYRSTHALIGKAAAGNFWRRALNMVFRSPRAFSAIQTRRSAKSSASTLFIAVVLLSPALALQVAPNSACASLCMDSLTSDASDPNVSNTFGRDVVCKDSDYTKSPVGSKFESCLNCLQGSSASTSNENDQGWFFCE